ncbi:glycosyltransferase, partial [Desulfovibrio sp. OttesenSCG-928-A18]|nr:glycosyltransferase [Desulfovibrio sp. OttesenSCG-928-A18]
EATRSSMNILYTNFHLREGGGHTTYIRNLLENPRHRTFVACPAGSKLYTLLEAEDFAGLIPMEFPSTVKDLGGIVRNSLALRRCILEHDIDIVHTNGSADNRIAMYTRWITRRNFKVVFTKHNMQKIQGFISKLRLNRFNDAVIFVSESVRETTSPGRDNPRYHVVEHGIDLDYWRKNTAPATGRHLRLISTAGTQKHKGWMHMIEAVSALPEEDRKRISVSVLGRHKRDSSLFPGCKVHFPGFLDDPRPLLEQADIGFVLSYKEASSFASREMSAMSLPVISSDFPNHTRNIDQSCGWVTRAGDADSIRRVLRAILDMPAEEITQMKLAARKKAEAYFSLKTMLERTNAVYDAVMTP